MATTKKRKRARACVFCRRSHLVCDYERPCARCTKRDIAHLCAVEEPSSSNSSAAISSEPSSVSLAAAAGAAASAPPILQDDGASIGDEFNSLEELLRILEDPLLTGSTDAIPPEIHDQKSPPEREPTPKEHFFLTAADPSSGTSPEDRLKLVIQAKLQAGLLTPYNYAKGYSRLQEYMNKNMSLGSKQRILKPLSTIRPAFRAIAKSLNDVDLIMVEEGFERILLSYDRVFTSMSMPACLWRRTGEVFRANREFANLVNCQVDNFRHGKMAIYELMDETSAVNYWEKYGAIAFDKSQKAVLTRCTLTALHTKQQVRCSFSFTIRRDKYNIPMCIVGNFIPQATRKD